MKIKNFFYLYKLKLKIRYLKYFFKNISYLISSNTNKNIIVLFIWNYFKKFKLKKNYLSNVYKDFVSSEDDWFTFKINILKHNLDKIKFPKNLKILEIGSYEGRSAIFFLNYFKNSKLFCVDTWEGSTEHKSKNFKIIEKNFQKNIKKFYYRINKIKTTSDDFFLNNKLKFDFIYIDGSHHYNQVFKDAVNSFNSIRKGGYILFDDYLWKFYTKKKNNPIFAINDFIDIYKTKIQVIFCKEQIFIKKLN